MIDIVNNNDYNNSNNAKHVYPRYKTKCLYNDVINSSILDQ